MFYILIPAVALGILLTYIFKEKLEFPKLFGVLYGLMLGIVSFIIVSVVVACLPQITNDNRSFATKSTDNYEVVDRFSKSSEIEFYENSDNTLTIFLDSNKKILYNIYVTDEVKEALNVDNSNYSKFKYVIYKTTFLDYMFSFNWHDRHTVLIDE